MIKPSYVLHFVIILYRTKISNIFTVLQQHLVWPWYVKAQIQWALLIHSLGIRKCRIVAQRASKTNWKLWMQIRSDVRSYARNLLKTFGGLPSFGGARVVLGWIPAAPQPCLNRDYQATLMSAYNPAYPPWIGHVHMFTGPFNMTTHAKYKCVFEHTHPNSADLKGSLFGSNTWEGGIHPNLATYIIFFFKIFFFNYIHAFNVQACEFAMTLHPNHLGTWWAFPRVTRQRAGVRAARRSWLGTFFFTLRTQTFLEITE